MRVVIRICPDNSATGKPNYYYEAADLEHFTVYESNVRQGGKEYNIDHIYDQSCSQFELYNSEVAPLIKDVVHGSRDCHLILAGHPNGGRKYTTTGPTEHPGILYRSLDGIFALLQQTPGKVYFSCFQIDREVMKDCLQPNNGAEPTIRLKDDPKKGVMVDRCTSIPIRNVQSGLEAFGEASSRMGNVNPDAHIVINISVERAVADRRKTGILSITLLGAVPIQASQTEMDQASKNKFQWTNHLNYCLESLDAKSPGIPFHKSKLTLHLREGLNGLRKSLVIHSLSPCIENYRTVSNNLALCSKIKVCTPMYSPPVQKVVNTKQKTPAKALPQAYTPQQTIRYTPQQRLPEKDIEAEYIRLRQQYIQQQQVLQQQQPISNGSLLYNGPNVSHISATSAEYSDHHFELDTSTDSLPYARKPSTQSQPKQATKDENLDTNITLPIKGGITPGKKKAKAEARPQPQARSANSSPEQGAETLRKKNREVTLLRHENTQLSHKLKELETRIESQEKLRQREREQRERERERELVSKYSPPQKVVQHLPIQLDEKQFHRASSAGKQRTPKQHGTPGKSQELDRYKEVMESSIKRMGEKIAALELQNTNLTKELAKKDHLLGKYRLSGREGSSVASKQTEKNHTELLAKLERANKRAEQLSNEKRDWEAQKVQYERQILVLKQLSGEDTESNTSVQEAPDDHVETATEPNLAEDLEPNTPEDEPTNEDYQAYEYEPQPTGEQYVSEQYEYEDDESEYDGTSQPQEYEPQHEYTSEPIEPSDTQGELQDYEYTEEALMSDNNEKIKNLEFELDLTRKALAHALHAPPQVQPTQPQSINGGFLRSNVVPPFINKS